MEAEGSKVLFGLFSELRIYIVCPHNANHSNGRGWECAQQPHEFIQDDRDCGFREAVSGSTGEMGIPDYGIPHY